MRSYNNFDRSYEHKTTGEMGYAIPICWKFTNPGDIWRGSMTTLIRLPKLDYPVMHRVYARVHWFWVRNSLLYDGWKDWWTGGEDGANSETHPYIQASTVTHSTLLNYLHLPAMAYGTTHSLNALPVRAYNTIHNRFYRDSQEISAVTVDTTDGLDTTTNTTLLKVAHPKNRLTTLRSEPQLGDALTVSLGGEAPVTGIGKLNQTYGLSPNVYETDGSGTVNYTAGDNCGNHTWEMEEDPSNSGYPNIRANLASATGLSVDDLRLAMALQRDREKKNNYGGRYSEVIRGEFGVNPVNDPDEPTYLGGGKSLVQFSEVIDTGTAQANIGDLYGHGINTMKTNRFQKYFREHGVLMGILSVVPEPIHTEMIPREYFYDSRTDYFDPDLEFIGEAEVTNKEIQADHGTPDGVFGYQKQYDECRTSDNVVSGLFDSGQTYNNAHYGIEQSGQAALNQAWIEATTTKRVQQDTNEPALRITAFNHLIAKQRMDKNPLPKFI